MVHQDERFNPQGQQALTQHKDTNPMSIATDNYNVHYRYIPGRRGDRTSLDHGAVMTEARRTLASAVKLFERLRTDPRIQRAGITKCHGKQSGKVPEYQYHSGDRTW